MTAHKRERSRIALYTHRCPVGHTWKSMLANAKNCPECRREEVGREAKEGKSGG